MTNWTPQQHAIIEAVKESRASLAINAVAGSGKTTTIVAAAQGISGSALALAFNASIAKELKLRLPRNIDSLTMNSLGHRAWGNFLRRPRLNVNAKKIYTLVTEAGIEYDERQNICRLVDVARHAGLVPAKAPGLHKGLLEDTDEAWEALADEYDLDFDEAILKVARQALATSCARALQGDIDFNDQIFMTVCYRAPISKYPLIMVDEAQDLSPMQHEMVKRALMPKGRVIVVGDPHQAIYGFRGASSNSFYDLAKAFDCQELPLSFSFRCAQSVVGVARKFVPHIEAPPEAPTGRVTYPPKDGPSSWTEATVPHGAAILCRNNAPLIRMAYRLLRARRGVHFAGRDIGQGLHSTIRKIGGPVETFLERLDHWERQEKSRKRTRAKSIEDKAESLRILFANRQPRTMADLQDEVKRIFALDNPDVHLSTIHKAKGLEWRDVFILDQHLFGEGGQESNLHYVAITRAKVNLTYVLSEDFR